MKHYACAVAVIFAILQSVTADATSYNVGTTKIEITEPDGYFSIRGVSEQLFSSVYATRDPGLLDFFCYRNAPSSVGACNYHRTLSARSSKELANLHFDSDLFTKIRKIFASEQEKNCKICLEQAKTVPGVLNVEFGGTFNDTSKYFGYSLIFTYADHKSAESIVTFLANGKILELHTRSNFESKEDIEWTRQFSVKWAEKTIAINP